MNTCYAIYGRIIDAVSDKPVDNGLVLVEGSAITYAGVSQGVAVPPHAEEIRIPEATILPGFIDCHAHLCGEGPEQADSLCTPAEHLLLNAAHDIGILLDAGFTGLRDMSRFGIHLKRAITRGVLRGPRIMPGGRVLSSTAGHVDAGDGFPWQYAQQRNAVGYMVDGPEDCLRGVRMQFREGAEFIKICATGGVSSACDGIDDVQFSDEEIRIMVEEAARHGTYVAAHCTGTAGTLQALRLGVTSIEHGIMLNEACVELMARNDCTLVTTLHIALGVAKMPGLPDYMRRKAENCAENSLRSYEMARKAGLRIALGTDFSNSPNTPYANNGREFSSIVQAGFTPMEAIRIGTINGAYLMKAQEQTGSLEEGKLADIVVVQGNPLENMDLLADKHNIKAVLLDGRLEKYCQSGGQ